MSDLEQEISRCWYLSRTEIENSSPSRKDGIDLKRETQLRSTYCSFLQDLGMRLAVPQLTIATAMLFCHRFFLCQSHAKNDSLTVATVCMFIASKVEDTPVPLDKIVIVAYEMIHRKDPAAAQQIHQKDFLKKQKVLIINGERLVLATIGFDFKIEHPYRPLVHAFNKFGISKDIRQVAWNYVNDWLRTTLCLQYKPHYIAAGSLFIAAKIHNIKLPSEKGFVWWHEFDVTPQQLNAVVQDMMDLLGYKRGNMVKRATDKKPPQSSVANSKEDSCSPESCVVSRPDSSTRSSNNDFDGVHIESINQNCSNSCNHETEHACLAPKTQTEFQARESESPTSVVENGDTCGRGLDWAGSEPDQLVHGLCKLDMDRILAMRKKRKNERQNDARCIKLQDMGEDDWIERELETGIEFSAQSVLENQRLS